MPVSAPLARLYSEYMHAGPRGIDSDYVFVNLFSGHVGAAMSYPAVHQRSCGGDMFMPQNTNSPGTMREPLQITA